MTFTIMSKLCSTCLSDDRIVRPFNSLEYKSICMEWFDTLNMGHLEMCWECRAIFLKINNFRRQVCIAQKIIKSQLKKSKSRNITKLSKLSVHTKTDYDKIYVTDENETSSYNINMNLSITEEQETARESNIYNTTQLENNLPNIDSKLKYMKDKTNCYSNIGEKDAGNNFNLIKEENNLSVEKYEIPTSNSTTHLKVIEEENNNSASNKLDKKRIENNEIKQTQVENKFIILHLSEEEMLEAREQDKNIARFKSCTYKCLKCVMGYFDEEKYERHLEEKHSEAAGHHVCPVCESHFPKEKQLNHHYNDHYKSYKCKLCGFQHHRINTMNAHHVKNHERETKYACKLCDMVFDGKRQLRYHRDVSHKELPKCKLCDKTFKNNSNLKEHISTHIKTLPSYACPDCPRRYRGKPGLRAHMRTAHQPPDEAAYCPECDVQYSNIHRYKRHVLESKKHRLADVVKYTCDHCDAKFVNKSYLKRHIARTHLRLLDISCHICHKKFAERRNLLTHIMEKHEGVSRPKDKICSYCGKGFHARNTLILHIRTHTGEKPYQCEYCSSSFAQKSALKTHVRGKHRDVEKKELNVNEKPITTLLFT